LYSALRSEFTEALVTIDNNVKPVIDCALSRQQWWATGNDFNKQSVQSLTVTDSMLLSPIQCW